MNGIFHIALCLVVIALTGGDSSEEWERCSLGPCECIESRLRVRCWDVHINDILLWQYFPQDIEDLVLRNNSISKLPQNFFVDRNLQGLQILKLRQNPLTEIESSDFVGVPDVKDFTIRRSDLPELPGDLLKEMPQLELVTLQQNQLLKTLPENLYEGLNNLVSLRFYDNEGLLEIPQALFSGPAQVGNAVVMRGSRGISDEGFPDDIFHSSPSMRSLSLENVGLTSVRKGLLGNHTVPRTWVSFTFGWDIQSIEPGAFDGMTGMYRLDLSWCDLSLEGIPDDLFVHVAREDNPLTVYMDNNPRLTEEPVACKVPHVTCIVGL